MLWVDRDRFRLASSNKHVFDPLLCLRTKGQVLRFFRPLRFAINLRTPGFSINPEASKHLPDQVRFDRASAKDVPVLHEI